jgi:penicillin-binding protein 1A
VAQGALVAMEPSGAIRSIVGGRDYTVSTFNRSYQARRQPGSSFKPFVYLAALEHGLSPDDIRDDAPYENRGWTPDNYDHSYLGPITLREALAKSINTVAVRVADEVGRRKVIAVAQRLGITSPLEPNRSLPLGTSEVTLYEMTRAFGAFANKGNRVDPYVILDVKTTDGTVLYQYRPAPPIPVMSRRSLEEMNQMLYEVVQTGTGQRGDMGERPVAAKTGTSQEWRDAWFVGYSADFVTGVWLGNDDNTSMQKIVGGSLPASIWKNYMQAAHRNIPVHSLPGIDTYGSSDYAEGGSEDDPWVDRGDDSRDRRAPGRDRGVIEDFFDSLFGDEGTALPAPPPPMGPRYRPQVDAAPEPDAEDVEDMTAAEEAAEDAAVRAAEARGTRGTEPRPPSPDADGPYRQPEADPNEPSPF